MIVLIKIKVIIGILAFTAIVITVVQVFWGNVNNQETQSAWQTEYMQYEELHEYSMGETQTIAVIDSGISEFQMINDQVAVVDLTGAESELNTNDHGTMMCSLLLGNNDIEGISPSTKVIAYKIVDEDGIIDGEILATAINLAKSEADIINISLGSYHNDPEVENAIKGALDDGVVVIAAAGDYEGNDLLYPANYDGVISVGALTEELTAWENTNAVNLCDILAPGENIKVANSKNEIVYTKGTSQATVLINGYTALLKDYACSKGISLNIDDLKIY